MTKVTYQGDHGDRIPAYLFLPKNLPENQKVPAIVVMHQSLASCGKKEPAGLCGKAWLNFAQDFAQRGYVVLAPDSIGYGERSNYYNNTGLEYSDAAPLLSRFPSSTLMGLRIADVMRGIDYLQTLPQVDADRIGMIGHSNGAIETLFTAAFDERVKCSVSNAGPNLIRRETLAWGGNKPGISRWAGGAYMPALGFFNNDVENLPIEIHQLYAMVAPRGLFISLIEDDSISPKFDRIQFSMDQAKRAFDAIGGNFAYHTVMSGLTPANKLEWGGPMNIAENYNNCKKSTDQTCVAAFDAVGMTAAAVAVKVYPEYLAHDLWKACLEKNMNSESACIAEFSNVGLTEASVQAAFLKYLKNDHGWYPEVENVAYPWLEDCLAR
jgi:dienelactone hydrolase